MSASLRRSMIVTTALLALSWPVLVGAQGFTGRGNPAGQAAGERPSLLRDVAFEQRLDDPLPLDTPFADEQGRSVPLGSYFHDRPVILAFVYYECPMLCTQVLNGLLSGLEVLDAFNPGREFEVVVVSFDPRETPALAAAKKAAYLERYRRAGAERGFHFLTGTGADIETLTRAAGFKYAYDKAIDQFAHAAGVVIATPDGRISKYLLGIEFAPRDLKFALMEAAERRIGTPVDQLLLFCYHYDPTTGRYGLVILNVVRAAGLATILGMAGFWIVMFRRERQGTA